MKEFEHGKDKLEDEKPTKNSWSLKRLKLGPKKKGLTLNTLSCCTLDVCDFVFHSF
jgi:hypothetical protein